MTEIKRTDEGNKEQANKDNKPATTANLSKVDRGMQADIAKLYDQAISSLRKDHAADPYDNETNTHLQYMERVRFSLNRLTDEEQAKNVRPGQIGVALGKIAGDLSITNRRFVTETGNTDNDEMLDQHEREHKVFLKAGEAFFGLDTEDLKDLNNLQTNVLGVLLDAKRFSKRLAEPMPTEVSIGQENLGDLIKREPGRCIDLLDDLLQSLGKHAKLVSMILFERNQGDPSQGAEYSRAQEQLTSFCEQIYKLQIIRDAVAADAYQKENITLKDMILIDSQRELLRNAQG